ncbi:MAG TPA: rod shape-determining protein MreC [Bacteroidales bacterium]|nr:rod shape-determining protein MreC [Bacteroidales bacterium]
MRSLLNFLLRYKSLILFLMMEGVALFMLSSSHNYHQTVASNIARTISGGLTERVEKGRSYFMLKRINRELVSENLMLRQRLETLKKEPATSFTSISDTLRGLSYNYLDAKVVNNSINRQKNFITLNKGRRDGVINGMGVACSEGVLGIVVGVSQNFSVAMSLLNVDFRLSSSIAHNDYFGSLAWDGKNYRYAQLSEIPHHVIVTAGDTIVTSGFSAIFPPGIMVGTLTGDQRKGGDFVTLKVELSPDFKRLTNVYIIGGLHKDEIRILEEEVVNE